MRKRKTQIRVNTDTDTDIDTDIGTEPDADNDGVFVPKARRLSEPEESGTWRAINAFKVQNVSDFPCDDTGTDAEVAAKSGLKKQKTAKEYAMYLVSSTVCTEHKLTDKLRKKGIYSDIEIDQALEYVKGFGYINDLKLAQNTLPKLAERLWGKSRICYYFRSRGISSDVIDSLDFSDIDFVFYCRRLAEKSSGKPFPKLMRTLLNAGYTGDEINEALEGTDINNGAF